MKKKPLDFDLTRCSRGGASYNRGGADHASASQWPGLRYSNNLHRWLGLGVHVGHIRPSMMVSVDMGHVGALRVPPCGDWVRVCGVWTECLVNRLGFFFFIKFFKLWNPIKLSVWIRISRDRVGGSICIRPKLEFLHIELDRVTSSY